jgi:hypothetical protein
MLSRALGKMTCSFIWPLKLRTCSFSLSYLVSVPFFCLDLEFGCFFLDHCQPPWPGTNLSPILGTSFWYITGSLNPDFVPYVFVLMLLALLDFIKLHIKGVWSSTVSVWTRNEFWPKPVLWQSITIFIILTQYPVLWCITPSFVRYFSWGYWK